ncbi:MAG: 5-formyltetrahydrofolate cyclo-ligase [Halomonadaceae bacterium]|nr:MAG: 5-formyltetrahydrofolate cyclo-ligase [Halomonadaceae bacterium]
MPSPNTSSRQQLRQQLRGRRRSLTRQQQRLAAQSLARQLHRLPTLRYARHIALYCPADGEIDPLPFMQALAHQRQRRFYLPVLHPVHHNRLWFRCVNSSTPLGKNRFGITEPQGKGPGRAPWALDVVLMPLVGFAPDGSRLGMGGGFYDRTFAFVRRWQRTTPKLIGLAHELQRVPALPQADWDIAMHSIVTDKGNYPAANKE